MTPDLQDSGLVIAAQVRSTDYTTIYDRVGVQEGLQLCNSHEYMPSAFPIVEQMTRQYKLNNPTGEK